jgi:hypothetical protein
MKRLYAFNNRQLRHVLISCPNRHSAGQVRIKRYDSECSDGMHECCDPVYALFVNGMLPGMQVRRYINNGGMLRERARVLCRGYSGELLQERLFFLCG